MGDDQCYQWRIEGGRDGRCNTAGYGNAADVGQSQWQEIAELADEGAEVNQWSILSDRGATTQ